MPSKGAQNLASYVHLVPRHPRFSQDAVESSEASALRLGVGAGGPRAGQGREVTWGGGQHHSPVAFHTVPLPEVQREDLAVEHGPLWERTCGGEKRPGPRRPPQERARLRSPKAGDRPGHSPTDSSSWRKEASNVKG